MATFFLIIIYLTFISLGLPDSLLGSAWSVMSPDIGLPLGSAGILSITISGGTILSSLLSERLIRRFGTGKVTFFSVMATALALLGYSQSHSVLWLIAFAIPLGLGGGSIDAALNNYVALHYEAHHMSWLHCFWGVGATLGPIVMAANIAHESNWRGGYLTIGLIQSALVILLFFTLPLWKRVPGRKLAGEAEAAGAQKEIPPAAEGENLHSTYETQLNPNTSVFHIKGVILALLAFLFYCGVESTAGLWGGTYLVEIRKLAPVDAARWISVYYGGITVGRLITGFLTMRLSCRQLIRYGQMVAAAGILLLFVPFSPVFAYAGFILTGLGLAPIFPCMIQLTPDRFGKNLSQKVIGLQMATAYIGATLLPPLLGLSIPLTGLAILPVLLILYALGMYIASERIAGLLKARI